MSEVSEEFERKAEACRRLADIAEDQYRGALWIERAAEWERLAAKAKKQQRQAIKAGVNQNG
jgi:hypothetical protein